MITLYDPKLEVFHFNSTFKRILGWTEEDATASDLMALAYPDPAVRVEAARYMVSLVPGWREFPVTSKDGTIVPSAWANLRLSDETHVGIGLDLRERKQSEELLRASEEQLRAAFAASPDAININRLRDGAYVAVNERFEQLSLWSRAEALGKTTAELNVWLDLEERDRLMTRLLNTGAVHNAETAFRRKDGSVFTASISAQLFETNGEQFLLAITRDISDLKRAEEALREADRRKDEFLGVLSHELRNPLAPIRNATYLLRHTEPGSEQARRAQSVIERQTEHLSRLVDDLLDVTRIAHGKIKLKRARVDLREVVRRVAEDYLTVMTEHGVTLRTALVDRPTFVDADPARISQIVGNLLHNAAKFTPHGGEVTASVALAGGEAAIQVRDTGVGIEPAMLPHLFDAFFQGEQTLARTGGGLGLGLALVKVLTEMHAGRVQVESAGVGKGTTFIVRLPLVPDDGVRPVAGEAVACEPQRDSVRPHRPCRVLVVDDDPDGAESLAEILRLLGHTVEIAHDGPTAIAHARAKPPEVVLCDIGLPGMSGYDVARALREIASGGIRLIAVSGYAQPDDVQRGVEAGFEAHVAKPCAPEEIERLVWARGAPADGQA